MKFSVVVLTYTLTQLLLYYLSILRVRLSFRKPKRQSTVFIGFLLDSYHECFRYINIIRFRGFFFV